MKKIILFLLTVFCIFTVTSCNQQQDDLNNEDDNTNQTPEVPNTDNNEDETPPQVEPEFTYDYNKGLSVGGFAYDMTLNKVAESDTNYIKVSTPMEFMDAIRVKAKESSSDNPMVIEILNDLNLGYLEIGDDVVNKYKSNGLTDFDKYAKNGTFIHSKVLLESGVSQIEISDVNNVIIYSKNGATIKHAGFKVTRCENLAFRNLRFDEMWQWEDSFTHPSWGSTTGYKLGDYDFYGWAYFKINFCENIWIDHCEFGKSYDGQIDVANESKNVHISWCNFLAGDMSDFVVNQMEEVKEYYEMVKKVQSGEIETFEGYDENKNKYYEFLRDSGIDHETIVDAIAMPQKKGFLIGDSDDPNDGQWETNKEITFSIANCYFKNFQDRIPRLRGGNAYIYNTIIDSTDFFNARQKIKTMDNYKDIASQISTNGWKLSLTSQAMVTSNGGAVKYKNMIVRGVDEVIKINNKDVTNIIYTGKYEVENSLFVLGDYSYLGDSGVVGSPWTNTSLTPSLDFRWNTTGGILPFEVEDLDVSKLEEILTNEKYGVGVKNASDFGYSFLQSDYTI